MDSTGRHSFVTHFPEDGADSRYIRDLLGAGILAPYRAPSMHLHFTGRTRHAQGEGHCRNEAYHDDTEAAGINTLYVGITTAWARIVASWHAIGESALDMGE